MPKKDKDDDAKILLLVRHAKSSWDDITQKDFDRPLNDRGNKDAPEMAKRIRKEKNITLDAIVTSSANRALTTAKFFAKEFDVKKKNIFKVDALFESRLDNYKDAVQNIDDSFDNVALFAHNPTVTAFANMLTNSRIDDMPTCAVFAVKLKTKSWKDFQEAEKEFLFFDYPKNIS